MGGAGGEGHGPSVKLFVEAEWSFENTTEVPILSLTEFCEQYGLNSSICGSLEEYGIHTTQTLFEVDMRDLEKGAKLKLEQIRELRRALRKLQFGQM
jgi:hypothetical protein